MKIQSDGKILLMILAFAGTFVFYSCSCSCTNSQSNIPDLVLKNSNKFIVSRVGQDFFDKYITPDFSNTKEINAKYYMVYSFKIPDKPYVDTKIKFTVDSTGRVTERDNVIGLPDCLSGPEKCQFNINKEQAVQIAKDNKFKQGIKDWKTEFKWEPKYHQYVWSILSTLEESRGSFGLTGNGEILLIDPNTGEIISKNPWRIM
jgi:hypothetical protein